MSPAVARRAPTHRACRAAGLPVRSRRPVLGQALIEYLAGCAVLAALLFVPVDGERPVLTWLAAALRDVVHGYGFLLSLS